MILHPLPLPRQAKWATLKQSQSYPDTVAEMRQLESRLAEAANCLTLSQNMVIYLRYWEGVSGRELAALCGWDESTTSYHHRKALDRMRKALYPLKFKDLMPD